MTPTVDIRIGEVRDVLRAYATDIEAGRARAWHSCVTSPPYWGLRNYGTSPVHWDAGSYSPMPGVPPIAYPAWDGELGLEPDPLMFVGHIVEVFRLLRDVLRDDATLWLNFGDCFTDGGRGSDSKSTLEGGRRNQAESRKATHRTQFKGLPAKSLVYQPARVALALQADGWILRTDVIWNKKNPMPESCTDRPTRAHEYVYLFSKSRRYFYDAQAIAEPVSGGAHARGAGVNPKAKANGAGSRMAVDRSPRSRKPVPSGWNTTNGSHHTNAGRYTRPKQNESFSAAVVGLVETRNCRDVWPIASEPYRGAHFATFPQELVRRPLLASTSEKGCCPACDAPWVRATKRGKVGWKAGCECNAGDPIPCLVGDCFGGSGTVGQVSLRYGRSAVLIDLNPKNHALMCERTAQQVLL